jgi:multisubunit Na+/H+ antiporter MnhF subunit
MYLIGFPLLAIPFAVYNIIEFLIPGANPGAFWAHSVIRIGLASGAEWVLTAGDLMIALSLVILFVEILKATRLSTRSIIDHLLSTALFVIMLIEFLLARQAATSTFFLLMIISFVDVVGGFSVSIRTAQRDIEIEGGSHITRS